MLSLSQADRPVLGADLNRSESSWDASKRSWTGGSNDAGVVRPSASAGVRLRRAYGAFRLQELSGYFRRAPPSRSVDNDAVKIDVHLSIDDRLARQHFRRRIPRLLLDDAVLNCFVEKDRKSTRLNSSHSQNSYAVFCLKKKKFPSVANSYNRLDTTQLTHSMGLNHKSILRYSDLTLLQPLQNSPFYRTRLVGISVICLD